MTKKELIAKTAKITGGSQAAAEIHLRAIITVMQEALVEGDKIMIKDFGTFETKTRAARKGRNPKTGAEIEIPASKAVAFKASKVLKDVVNK